MNYTLIYRILGLILAAIAAAFCLSALWTWDRPEALQTQEWRAWSLSLAPVLTLSFLLLWLGRHASVRLYRKEALMIIGLGWLLATLAGALPYVFLLPHLPLADAIFESASGLTTTGASVFATVEELPPSLLFWRALSQWIGGLGVVVFFVAILSFLGAGAKILFSNETSAKSQELDQSRIQSGVLHILLLYLCLSALCAITFHLCGLDWFDAVCHMFATLSTGGFSTRNTSIAAYANPVLEWAIIVYMILGGTSFLYLLRRLGRQRTGTGQKLFQNSEVRTYLGLLATFTALITLLLAAQQGWHPGHLRAAAFQVTSIMTTTGFGTADYTLWPVPAQALLLTLMIIGGCSGSTSGGLKVVRLVVLLKIARNHVEKSFRARIVRPIHINGKPLDEDSLNSVLHYTILVALIGCLSIPLLSLLEPELSLDAVLGAIPSALFNVGPALAELGPSSNYGALQAPAKYLLSLLMLMGRIECIAILALFMPSLWKRV